MAGHNPPKEDPQTPDRRYYESNPILENRSDHFVPTSYRLPTDFSVSLHRNSTELNIQSGLQRNHTKSCPRGIWRERNRRRLLGRAMPPPYLFTTELHRTTSHHPPPPPATHPNIGNCIDDEASIVLYPEEHHLPWPRTVILTMPNSWV
jgi:hypothetical protein